MVFRSFTFADIGFSILPIIMILLTGLYSFIEKPYSSRLIYHVATFLPNKPPYFSTNWKRRAWMNRSVFRNPVKFRYRTFPYTENPKESKRDLTPLHHKWIYCPRNWRCECFWGSSATTDKNRDCQDQDYSFHRLSFRNLPLTTAGWAARMAEGAQAAVCDRQPPQSAPLAW